MILELRFFDILTLGFIGYGKQVKIEFSIIFHMNINVRNFSTCHISSSVLGKLCCVYKYVSCHYYCIIIACNFCPSYKIVLVYTQTLGQMLPCVVCAPPVLRGPMQ